MVTGDNDNEGTQKNIVSLEDDDGNDSIISMMSSFRSPNRSEKSIESYPYSLVVNNQGMKKSFRIHEQIVNDLYTQHTKEQPYLTVLSRRDALTIQQEETLLKSNKVYIREHIQHKIIHNNKHMK